MDGDDTNEDKIDDSELDVQKLLSQADAKKTLGNERFKAGEFGPACTAYQEGVELLTSVEATKLLREWWEWPMRLPRHERPGYLHQFPGEQVRSGKVS